MIRPIALILALIIPIASPQIDRLKSEREEKVRERKRVELRLRGAIEREKGLLAELERLDRSLYRLNAELRRYAREADRIEKELEAVRAEMKRLAEEERALRSRVCSRLRAIYKAGYPSPMRGYLAVLLSAGSLAEMISLAKYVSAIAEADRRLLEEFKGKVAELKRRRAELEEKARELEGMRATIERKRREVERARRRREELLDRCQREKETYARALRELERSIEMLDRLIDRLSGGEMVEGELRIEGLGSFSPPVKGAIVPNISPRLKGVTIKAPKGEEVLSIGDGIVEYARWFDGLGLGLMVIINHGNGYRSLYAHLGEIFVREGERVEKGQAIGIVGETGSLLGPALYFEIRRGLIPIDIRRWLR